jgi:hypothetical protein
MVRQFVGSSRLVALKRKRTEVVWTPFEKQVTTAGKSAMARFFGCVPVLPPIGFRLEACFSRTLYPLFFGQHLRAVLVAMVKIATTTIYGCGTTSYIFLLRG